MPDNHEPSFAKRLVGGAHGAKADGSPEADQTETSLARRTVGEEPMLELRFKNGESDSLAYSYLWRARYVPETGITLKFPPFCEVVIEGHALRQLYMEIKQRKRAVIEELSSPAVTLGSTDRPHISKIRIIEDETEHEKEKDHNDTRNAQRTHGR